MKNFPISGEFKWEYQFPPLWPMGPMEYPGIWANQGQPPDCHNSPSNNLWISKHPSPANPFLPNQTPQAPTPKINLLPQKIQSHRERRVNKILAFGKWPLNAPIGPPRKPLGIGLKKGPNVKFLRNPS